VNFLWLPYEYRGVIHDALDHVLLLAKRPAPIPFSPSSNTAGIYSQAKMEARSRTTRFKAGYFALCPVKFFSSPVHTT
jgi:hypothetical protein